MLPGRQDELDELELVPPSRDAEPSTDPPSCATHGIAIEPLHKQTPFVSIHGMDHFAMVQPMPGERPCVRID
jgi:hypothetical protein